MVVWISPRKQFANKLFFFFFNVFSTGCMSNIAQSSLSPSFNAAVVVYVPGAGKDEGLRPPGGVAATEKRGRRKLEAVQGWRFETQASLSRDYLLLQPSVTADWSKRGLRGGWSLDSRSFGAAALRLWVRILMPVSTWKAKAKVGPVKWWLSWWYYGWARHEKGWMLMTQWLTW